MLDICDGFTVAKEHLLEFDSVLRDPLELLEILSGRGFYLECGSLRVLDQQHVSDEVLIVKGLSSSERGATAAMPSAFDDPRDPEMLVPRISIKIRFFAFYR